MNGVMYVNLYGVAGFAVVIGVLLGFVAVLTARSPLARSRRNPQEINERDNYYH